MTTAYTSLLGLALPVTGELDGTWGDVVNNSITTLLDSAIAGTTTISTDADVTLTTTTGSANQAREAILLWTANGTTTRNITAPAQSKIYTVINASAGTQSIVLRGAGPTTGVTIVKGESAVCAWNGSDFIKISNSSGSGTFTDLTVTGNTTLGDAAADTLTVNATSTFASPVNFQGLVKLPSTGRSAAAALTTTAPAFLYGVASTYTDTTSSGTISAMAPFYSIAQPTLSTSNVTTYTNASTLYIANAPATGGSATITNPYALYVASGANYFGGNSSFASNVTFGDASADTVTFNGTITSNLLFTDSTYDIGANSANRPRSLYLASHEYINGNIFQNAATASSWDNNWNALQGSSGSLAQLSTGNDIRLYLNLAVIGGAQKYVANGDASALIMQGSQLIYTQYTSGTAGASATSTTGYWKFVDGKFGVGYTSAQTPPAALSTLNGSIAIQNTTTSTNTSIGTIKAYSDYSGSNYLLGSIDFSTSSAADNGKMILYTGYAGALSYGVQLTYGGVYLYGRGSGTPANVYLSGAGNSSGVRDIAYMWYATDAAAKKWATVRVGTTGTALDDNSTLKLHSNVNGTTYDTLVLQNNAVGFNVTPSGTYGIEQSSGTSTTGSTVWSAYYGMASSNGAYFGNGTGALYGSYTNSGVAPTAGFASYLIDGGSTATNYGGGAIIAVKNPNSSSLTRMWYFDQYGSVGGAATQPPPASAHGFFPGTYGWFGDDSGTGGVSCQSGANIYYDGNWRARVTGPTYSTLYQQNSADGSHNWYASTSTTAGGSVVSSLANRATLERTGNLILAGNIIPSYTEYTVSITGVSANTWTDCINTGVLVTGGYYWVAFRWDHNGSGQPYIVSGSFMFTTVNTNGTGGDNEFLPLNATHTGSGTSYNISFRAKAGSASTTGMQYKLNNFTGNGNLRVRMYYFGGF